MSKQAEIHTDRGVMTVEFYENDAPKTVANFCKLASEGFYDGLRFHRVIPDFVVQAGCPHSREKNSSRAGTGGPGYQIDCETQGENQYHDKGVLSMAHAGRNTGGSQFFICHGRQNTSHLDRQHTVFGKVVKGVDIVDEIRKDDLILKIVVL
ncbi:MAG: peptidylprolyl isomerase [Salinivirgaceae bacterium]|nr:peptidylprolyl isomerase [Salinivirgaceae bacterium]MDD4746797.1 peptidylprolyl isomerase [Salinivirgaceae bacterium]MDY0282688.1 peptidylprolyl isomerase [Salinivirgaceae bacterium]